jgi:hypothetical protein
MCVSLTASPRRYQRRASGQVHHGGRKRVCYVLWHWRRKISRHRAPGCGRGRRPLSMVSRGVGIVGHGRRGTEATGCSAPLRSSRCVADAVAHETAKVAHLGRRAEHRHDGGGSRRSRQVFLVGLCTSLACGFVCCSRHAREVGSAAGAPADRHVGVPVGVLVAQHGATATLGVLFCMSVAAWRAVRVGWLRVWVVLMRGLQKM